MVFGVRELACAAALALWLGASRAHGSDAPLTAVADADPLALAGVVARAGDDRVLAELRRGVPPLRCLAAIRAARWLRAPERALQPLVGLVLGRDPELRRAAARAAAAIAHGLDFDVLARRELLPRELSAARAALAKAAEEERLPADVRALVAGAALSLQLAGVP